MEKLIANYKSKVSTLEMVENRNIDPLFGKVSAEQVSNLKLHIEGIKIQIMDNIKNKFEKHKHIISNEEYQTLLNLTFKYLVDKSITLEEDKGLQLIYGKIDKEIEINNKNDVLLFIANDLGLDYSEEKDCIKGKVWATWKIKFLKSGKISFNARGVTKRFDLTNGYDLKQIFIGFEVI